MSTIKKDYVVFATSKDEGYVEIEKVELEKVPSLVAGETKPVSAGDGYADYTVIEYRLKGLAGKILTIIDTAIPQGQQNKCTKDLVRAAIIDEYTYFGDELFDQERLNEMANEAFEQGLGEPVGFEEILGK